MTNGVVIRVIRVTKSYTYERCYFGFVHIFTLSIRLSDTLANLTCDYKGQHKGYYDYQGYHKVYHRVIISMNIMYYEEMPVHPEVSRTIRVTCSNLCPAFLEMLFPSRDRSGGASRGNDRV